MSRFSKSNVVAVLGFAFAILLLAEPPRLSADQAEFAGQWGGSTYAVAVQGQVAYVGCGPRLLVLDISDPNEPTLLGRSQALPGVISGVVMSGSYAYVADSDGGLQIIDVSNPAAPVRVGNCGTSGSAKSVAVLGSYAYVAAYNAGLQIVDVSNPVDPNRVGGYDMSGLCYGVAISGNYAYVANGDGGLRIIDVSNPTKPEHAGVCNTSGYASGVTVSGIYAYVADSAAGLQVIDVSNPALPVRRGGWSPTSEGALAVTVSGGLAYVANSWAGLQIIDVSDPNQPQWLGGCATRENALGVALTGSYALVVDGNVGLQAIDVSNPLQPQRVGGYEKSGYALGVAVAGSYAYVADEHAGLRIIDFSNPEELAGLGRWSTNEPTLGVAVSGSYAYLANHAAGLQIIDISNPVDPQWVGGKGDIGYANGVAISGNYAYLAVWGDGLQIIDVSNPVDPNRMGGCDTSGFAQGVAVSGSYAYVADGDAGLQIIDVSNPLQPQRVGGYNTGGSAHGVAVLGNYAYVADDNAGLEIINVSNPAKPLQVGSYNTSGSAYAVALSGSYAYVADYDAGVQIIDVSNPTSPVPVGGYNTSGHATGVAVASFWAHVADGDGGLVVLHLSFLDCNHNGVADADDIANGTSQDCNQNGVPDECETDCNDNGIPDECDIADGTSLDCNHNGVPDECEPDCNGNGVPDMCDIARGTSQDCNHNGVPDECDIASDVSKDCVNALGQSGAPDGIPDECEPAPSGLINSRWDDAAGVWSAAANWCPLLPVAPNNSSTYTFDVTIADPTSIVTLDVSPTIDDLAVNNDAVIEVNAASGATVRTLVVVGSAIQNDGTLRAKDGRRLLIDASDINQTNDGAIEAIGQPGEASKIQINGQTVTGGTIRTQGDSAAVELLGGAVLIDVTIEGGGKSNEPSRVRVPDGQTGILGETIVNDGVVLVGQASGHAPTYLMPSESGLILSTSTGAGHVVMVNRLARLGDFFGFTLNDTGHRIEGAGILFGDFVNEQGAFVVANNQVDPLLVSAPGFKANDGVFAAMNGGVLKILTDITGHGWLMAAGGTVVVGDDDEPVIVDEDGPVIVDSGSAGLIEVRGSQLIHACYWRIGNEEVGPDKTATLNLLNGSIGAVNGPVHVHQNGTLRIAGSSLTATDLILDNGAELFVSGSANLAGSVTLSGLLDNRMTDGGSASWSWAAGSALTLSGGQSASAEPCKLDGWATLEAASADAGPSGGNGDLEFADIILAAGAGVCLVDSHTNHNLPAAPEAVYCDALTLEAGSVLNLNGLKLYVAGVAVSVGAYSGGVIQDEPRGLPHGDFDGGGLGVSDIPLFVDALLSSSPRTICTGDMNHDGLLDGWDIQPFLQGLVEGAPLDVQTFVAVLLGSDTDPAHVATADFDDSGTVDGADIQPFVNLLLGP